MTIERIIRKLIRKGQSPGLIWVQATVTKPVSFDSQSVIVEMVASKQEADRKNFNSPQSRNQPESDKS
jgi:hypothetical protein